MEFLPTTFQVIVFQENIVTRMDWIYLIDARPYSAHVFDTLDKNEDGTVTFEQFLVGKSAEFDSLLAQSYSIDEE